MSEAPTISGMQVTIDIPRAMALTSNQPHSNYGAVARKKAALRSLAAVRCGQGRAVFLDRVRCVVNITWPDNRRRDAHNLMPTLKACVDGFVDAGLLEDDDDRHLIGPDLRVSELRCEKGLACSLTFRFESVSA